MKYLICLLLSVVLLSGCNTEKELLPAIAEKGPVKLLPVSSGSDTALTVDNSSIDISIGDLPCDTEWIVCARNVLGKDEHWINEAYTTQEHHMDKYYVKDMDFTYSETLTKENLAGLLQRAYNTGFTNVSITGKGKLDQVFTEEQDWLDLMESLRTSDDNKRISLFHVDNKNTDDVYLYVTVYCDRKRNATGNEYALHVIYEKKDSVGASDVWVDYKGQHISLDSNCSQTLCFYSNGGIN